MLLAHGNNLDDLGAALLVLFVLVVIGGVALWGGRRDKKRDADDS